MIERMVQQHAGKLCLAVMASGLVLYNALEFLSPKDSEFDYYENVGHDKRPLTLEQARLQAMIENAKQSSWQENLNNALVAQEKFMLGNERGENPKFMKEIDQRSHQLMKEQQEKTKQEKKEEQEDPKRRPTATKFW